MQCRLRVVQYRMIVVSAAALFKMVMERCTKGGSATMHAGQSVRDDLRHPGHHPKAWGSITFENLCIPSPKR